MSTELKPKIKAKPNDRKEGTTKREKWLELLQKREMRAVVPIEILFDQG